MVHLASGYARQRNRLGAFACTSSVGPGATNMVTGAALATVNRLPVLLLPGDTFASRAPHPVLQQLEAPHDGTISVNDCFRPVCRYFDRVNRPEQLVDAALAAMRVLTDPGGDRRGLPRAARGRADRGRRGARRVPRRAHVDDLPPPARARRARARGEPDPGRAAAARRRRRRRHLRGGDRRAARVRRGDRHPGGGDAGRPRLAAVVAPAPRSARSARPARPPRTGSRATPTS